MTGFENVGVIIQDQVWL